MNVQCSRAVLIKLSFYLSNRRVEQVAALLGKRVGERYIVLDVIPASNEGAVPQDSFFVSYGQLASLDQKARRKGCTLLGVAHSHLAHHPVDPSPADLAYCVHAVNAVYHPATRRLTWFNGRGEKLRQSIHPAYFWPYNGRMQLSF